MADDVDLAAKNQEQELALRLKHRRAELVPGEPGECRVCGEESPRLVGGACAPCRDRYRLP